MSAAPSPIEDVLFAEEGIRLGQFLKFVGAVEDGQEAKSAIAAGMVKVDGEIDERRGAQLREGQVIEFNGAAWRITLG